MVYNLHESSVEKICVVVVQLLLECLARVDKRARADKLVKAFDEVDTQRLVT